MAQYKLLLIKEIPGGNNVKICKVDQTTFTVGLSKQGCFLYLCTPVQYLLPKLSVYKFQLASGANALKGMCPVSYSLISRLSPVEIRHV